MGFVYLQTWTKSNYKKKIDYESGEKYLDYNDPVRKKLLQEPDRIEIMLSEGHKCSVNSYFRIWMAYRDIIPSIFERYHDLFQTGELEGIDINSVAKGIDILLKFLTPFSSRSVDSSGSFFDNRSMYRTGSPSMVEHCSIHQGTFVSRNRLRSGVCLLIV